MRAVDRHRRVDAVEVAVVRRAARGASRARRAAAWFGRVAVDLVRRREDEGRVRRVRARRLEQVERADRVDREVGLRLARRPVVRRLRGGVDDQLELARMLARRARIDAFARRECRGRATRNSSGSVSTSRSVVVPSTPRARRTRPACRSRSRRRRSPSSTKCAHGLRADQPAGAGDDRSRPCGRSSPARASDGALVARDPVVGCPRRSSRGLRRGRQSVWREQRGTVRDVDRHVARAGLCVGARPRPRCRSARGRARSSRAATGCPHARRRRCRSRPPSVRDRRAARRQVDEVVDVEQVAHLLAGAAVPDVASAPARS